MRKRILTATAILAIAGIFTAAGYAGRIQNITQADAISGLPGSEIMYRDTDGNLWAFSADLAIISSSSTAASGSVH